MRSVFTYYKNRLVEISGKSRSLFVKRIGKKYAYDIGKVLSGDFEEISYFTEFLWKSKRYSYPLINKEAKERLAKNLGVENKVSYLAAQLPEGDKSNALKIQRARREETKRAMLHEVSDLTALKREIEEFSKETGRYELFIGYPFVQGYIGKDLMIRAPLLLFPVVIDVSDETTVEIELKRDEAIQLNKVFLLAYSKYYRLNLEEMETEFSGSLSNYFKNIGDVMAYLKKFGVNLKYTPRKGMSDFGKAKDPQIGDALEIKHYCVMGRFPLANSIYNDYAALEKQRLTNEAIDELINTKSPKKIKKPDGRLYTVNSLDYAQENTILNLNYNGNMVIYGPPGTGKSQTIVNIISDALCKNKRVLVVSQKKAALDVVYNRLGNLNSKVMFITDPEKNKTEFYERTKSTHLALQSFNPQSASERYAEIDANLQQEICNLTEISNTLFGVTPFGITLQEMYAASHMIGKNSYDYTIYKNMIKNSKLLGYTYHELSENLRLIKEKNKGELYYKFVEQKKKNPLIDNIRDDLDLHVANQAKAQIQKLLAGRIVPFDMGEHEHSRQLIAYFLDSEPDNFDLKPLVKFVASGQNPNAYKALKASYVFFPALPFTLKKVKKHEEEVEQSFRATLEQIKEYTKDFAFLERILTPKGYLMMIDNVLNGNTLYLRLLATALESYLEIRDLNITLRSLNEIERTILNFAYSMTNTFLKFKEVLKQLLSIRIYHEIVKLEETYKNSLSKILDFENTKNRITSLKREQMQISREICMDKFKQEYLDYYSSSDNNKNFLYQISKQQNLWPVRKLMDVYGEFMLRLFPCWLLSPESVSTIMPLRKDMFDIVLFDEASQVFIENSIPSVFRGKNIVVAGDGKQLRPTATFMKRYMGNDYDDDLDENQQAALEVESLLDLAVARYNSTNLTYHYRSKSEELINFSNHVFYDGNLQIAPNTTKNRGKKPIERVLVSGRWINRRNEKEAETVVGIIKKIFKQPKPTPSIGIITFNTEQEVAIEDAIERECYRDAKFRDLIIREQNRKENGEDISLFVKNLENVQGDERDVIIFSIGYAPNEQGRVAAHFGSLSIEGGENRLNVAITRAKEKIYVVTSIEPEELKVEGTKNAGPKILKNYLKYVRAISGGRGNEAKIILQNYNPRLENKKETAAQHQIEKQIKQELEKLGYLVETNLGNTDYKLSLAIYDKKLDRYLLGVECDYSAYGSSNSILERDVYRPAFLASRGWTILRVWSRDWWQNRSRVIATIQKIAERNRQKFTTVTDK